MIKILLTGKPGSGKTTLLAGFIAAIPGKQGFLTREVREDGERVGFELVSSLGQTAGLASVNSNSNIRVSRYGVEVTQLDNFLADLPPVEADKLIYVDEIGQMQLFSNKSEAIIMNYLNSDNLYIGTITSVFQHDFVERVLGREDVVLLRIDIDNREQVRSMLSGLAKNVELLCKLNPAVQQGLTAMAKDYAHSGKLLQLEKLFSNTIKYLAEGNVKSVSGHTFQVRGNTNEHTVTHNEDWACDCNLFMGTGSYQGNAGECSHIQSVKLSV